VVAIEPQVTGMENEGQVTYQLYGVIMHSGRSAHHGHYYAYARPAHFLPETGEADETAGGEGWYLFNDSLVQRTTYRAFSAISQKFSSDVPYLLFYVREPPPDRGDNNHDDDDDVTKAQTAAHVHPVLAHEVEADNARFLVEQETAARRAAQLKKNRYAYAQASSPFFRYSTLAPCSSPPFTSKRPHPHPSTTSTSTSTMVAPPRLPVASPRTTATSTHHHQIRRR
jgi:hypothetical protein